jgi:DNA-binding transcriptional ArsR family regulator
VRLGVAELAGTRFAVSALSETVSGLQQLAGVGPNPLLLRWRRWAAERLADEPFDLPHAWPLVVTGRPSWPEFLVPAPADPGAGIDADLAALRRTTAGQVRTSLDRVFGADPPAAARSLRARPAAGLRRVATELRLAHDRLVAPHWPRIRAVLDADIAHRARRLADGGARALFADLHPDLSWLDDRLVLGKPGDRNERMADLGPGGLVLVPVVLGPPWPTIRRRTSTQTTVRYPARGVGALWTAGTAPPPAGLVQLLGRTRAELLEALRSPATTGDLARAFGVTPSAISQHLRVLRDTGLVGRTRAGRSVLHLTTALGADLLG